MSKIEDVSLDFDIVSRETSFEGFRSVATIAYRETESGAEATREVVLAQDAVAVVAFDPALAKLVMIRQFRLPAQMSTGRGFCCEVVAGLIDEGEDAEACARRELTEETGLVATRVEPLCSFLTTPGMTDEVIHLFYAEVDASSLASQSGAACETERTFPFTLTAEEAMEAVMSNGITNGIAMVAIHRFMAERDRLLAKTAA